jgi:hypothetical protein
MERTCEHCGLLVAAGDRFCGGCGQPSPDARPAESAQLPASPRPSWPRHPGPPAPAGAAPAQHAPNEQYLGHRLVYDKVPEASFDPIGNPRLLRQFLMHWLLYFAVYITAGLVFGVVLLILAAIGIGFGAAATLWWIGAAVVGVLFLCLFWLIPVPAQLSEWKFFVDGQAHVAPVTFDHIAWALQQRQTPLDTVQVRRLKLAGAEARDYLEVRRGLFSGLICCFGYGNDLYVGWTFWLRISPARCLAMFAARLWQTLMRRGTDLYVSLRYDYARAMREVIHSVAREAVDVAVGDSPAQGQAVASELRVTVTDVG